MTTHRRGRPPGPSRKIDATCSECGRKFDNPIGYGNHLRKVHDLIAPEKKCWGCEETKPIEQFPRAGVDMKGRPKYAGKCSECRNRGMREGRALVDRPESHRRRDKRKRAAQYFGLTLEEYEAIWAELYEKQEGKCAICMKDFEEHHGGLDHDHKTGRPRGLLCRYCNLGLGHFDDSTDRLFAAARYLLHPVELTSVTFHATL